MTHTHGNRRSFLFSFNPSHRSVKSTSAAVVPGNPAAPCLANAQTSSIESGLTTGDSSDVIDIIAAECQDARDSD
jgi:hypothetical protein